MEKHQAARELKSIITDINQLETMVFWVRSTNLQKQFYVNPAYEQLCKRSCDSLYQNPMSFENSLIEKDSETVITTLQQREQEAQENCYAFHVIKPDGLLQPFRDFNSVLLNSDKQKIAIAGCAEAISESEFEAFSQNDIIQPSKTVTKLFEVFIKAYNLNLQNAASYESTEQEEKGKLVLSEQGMIWLSRREWQCVCFLLMDKSAKQTAWELGISVRTVETYINSLRKKLKCRTKLGLINQLWRFNNHEFL